MCASASILKNSTRLCCALHRPDQRTTMIFNKCVQQNTADNFLFLSVVVICHFSCLGVCVFVLFIWTMQCVWPLVWYNRIQFWKTNQTPEKWRHKNGAIYKNITIYKYITKRQYSEIFKVNEKRAHKMVPSENSRFHGSYMHRQYTSPDTEPNVYWNLFEILMVNCIKWFVLPCNIQPRQ